MPDDQQELRRISLTEIFPFTQLFRSFRLAIHPHKLLLALVALLMTYALGRIMDQIWPSTPKMPPAAMVPTTQLGTLGNVVGSEVRAYIDLRGGEEFCDWHKAAKKACVEGEARLLTMVDTKVKLEDARKIAESGDAREDILDARDDASEEAEAALEVIGGKIKKGKGDKEALYDAYEDVAVATLIGPTVEVKAAEALASLAVLAKDKDLCSEDEVKLLRKAISAQQVVRELNQVTGQGIFAAFLNHEIATFHKAIQAILALNVGLASDPPAGLKANFIDAIGGIVWLFGAHWFYAVVFTLLALLIWSLFGGAICRIAALHAARDEKISFKQSLKFSGRKLFSFFSAPLIPVGLVVVIGAVVVVGGLLGAIPYVGEIFAGVLWPLALLSGFIMVLVIIGTVSGWMLMFPTIAVEGSDSFDALSRSFSYVYSKPWRTAFYVLVSGLYGAVCYLFVRLFAHMLLNATHVAAGLGMNADGSHMLPETVGKLDAIWSRTGLLDAGRFYGAFGQYPLNGSESVGAFLIMVWTFVVVGSVIAFTISFYFSASTMIYYLLRREVDATDIEDVYLEEYEEEMATVAAPPEGEAERSAEAEGSTEAEKPAEAEQPEETPPAEEPPAEGAAGEAEEGAEGEGEDKPNEGT